jgi:hypothetical protein
MLTGASLRIRLGMALLPGLLVLSLSWLEDLFRVGSTAEVATAWSFPLMLGAFVLAPFATAVSHRWLRIAGLLGLPSVMIVPVSVVYALAENASIVWTSVMALLVYTYCLILLTVLLAPRARGPRFKPLVAAYGVVCALSVGTAAFGFDACFFSSCSAIDKALLYGGLVSILFLLPPAFVITIWYGSEPQFGSEGLAAPR